MTNPTRIWTGQGTGHLLGYQSGAMVRRARPRQFAGQRMLVVAGVFAAGVLALKLIVAVATNVSQVVWTVAPLLLIVALMFLVYRLILGRWVGTVARTAFRAGTRISGAVVGPVAGPSAANSVVGRVRAAIRAGRVVRNIPVRQFQVRPVAGGPIVPCLLRGEPDGAESQHGDILRLRGHAYRSGEFAVQRIEVLGSPGGSPALRVIRGRLVGTARTTLWWSRFC